MKKEFLEKVESLEAEIKKLKEQALADKTTALEKGKWYKNSYNSLFNYQGSNDMGALGWGFLFGYDWSPHNPQDNSYWGKIKDCRPATKEEVQAALIKEAEKRGFKIGVPFERIRAVNSKGELGASFIGSIKNLTYFPSEDKLLCADTFGIVYCKGQWAKIIREPEVTIAGYKVEYNKDLCRVGCQTFSREDIGSLLGCMNAMNIESVIHTKGGEVKKEQIQKILDNWK